MQSDARPFSAVGDLAVKGKSHHHREDEEDGDVFVLSVPSVVKARTLL
jgi:hypothetical protein